MSLFYDTLLWEYIQKPGDRWLSLEELADKHLNYQVFLDIETAENMQLPFETRSADTSSKYAGENMYIIGELYERQKESKISEDTILQTIECPLVPVLTRMEHTGIRVSREILQEIGVVLETGIAQEEKEIFVLAGQEFNIKSPKQVGELLFDTMKLPHGKKTKTGYSVDVEVLEYLAYSHPIARHILNHRQYSKLLSTYVEWLQKLIRPETQTIHTSYQQAITTTGRLSSTAPNLQNIPTGSGLSGKIREAFIPFDEEKDILMAFDYSQIEVRLLALMSEDPNLLASFSEGIDIHKATAQLIFNTQDITSDQRRIAKTINFWVIYGISPFGLAKQLGSSQKEAAEYIRLFYERYAKVQDFFTRIVEEGKVNGYVQTMFGRKRFLPHLSDANANIRKAAEREAINMPIQGSSADIIKIAMIRVDEFLRKEKLESTLLLQVHDELVLNVPQGEQEIIATEIPRIMENIVTGPIILKVDMGSGKNWRGCK